MEQAGSVIAVLGLTAIGLAVVILVLALCVFCFAYTQVLVRRMRSDADCRNKELEESFRKGKEYDARQR